MADKKTILEEALMDAQTIQNALNANTREILRSVAREEIDGLVKESLLKEDDFEEEDLDAEVDVAEPEAGMGSEEPDFGGEGEADLELGDESGLADEMGDSAEVGPEMGQELGMDADALGGEDLDMTAASDDDVISIYKKLSGEDEIEIVGDDIHLNVSEPGEYVIKGAGAGAGAGVDDMGGEEFPEEDLEEVPTGADDMGAEAGDDAEYEIELDSEDDAEGGDEFGGADAGAEEEAPEADFGGGEEEEEEEPIDEQISQNRVAQNRAGGDLTQIKGAGAKASSKLSEGVTYKKLVLENNPKYKAILAENKAVLSENARYKSENIQFRQALTKFRGMLVETVVFNSNLSYVTKLFMEHSTTKAEKMNIIARFDEEVSNLKESKRLYKTITNELTGRKPIVEAVESKLNKSDTSSSSKTLNESTVYVDASTQRIKDLMKRVDKK